MKFLTKGVNLVAVVAVLALVVGLALVFFPRDDKNTVTADFPRAVSLYEGSDVKILGVPVGTVDKVRPAGTKTVVTITYDAKYDVPSDAKAVLVSPSIVGDRYIQLTPAYQGGPKLPDDAHLGVSRTATPVELDTIYSSLTQLSTALGPNGANKPDASGVGPLTRLLNNTAANLGGQGEQVNKTIRDIAALTQTLDDNKDELFGSVREIEGFIGTLANNDTTVRRFNDALSQASDLLAGERGDLAAALKNLSTALVDVRGFVRTNRGLLTKNITGLRKVSDTLVKRRDQLDDILRVAPGALNNLGLAYNPATGTLDQRTNFDQNSSIKGLSGGDLGSLVCAVGKVPAAQCSQLSGALGLNRAAALQRSSTPVDPGKYVDRSLGGLVEAHR